MTALLAACGDLIFAGLLIVAAVCIGVAVCAVRDVTAARRSRQREWDEIARLHRARAVTSRRITPRRF